MSDPDGVAERLPLHDWHLAHGARLAPFAGYAMPMQYAGGIRAEHLHTRSQAALFDASHMGVIAVEGADAIAALTALLPMDVGRLAEGRQRYGLLLNEQAGIVDDLMLARCDGRFHLVVNAGRKRIDLDHVRAHAEGQVSFQLLEDRCLLALQGPAAAAVMARLIPGSERLAFMALGSFATTWGACMISRSGYTGEDGFEIICDADRAKELADALCGQEGVQPAGLGARNSLRLEAGLCLYGQDMDEAVDPVDAGLLWTVPRRRLSAADFLGGPALAAAIDRGPGRLRVGLTVEGRHLVREGAALMDPAGRIVGTVTSGSFGFTVNAAVAMALVAADCAGVGGRLYAAVRGEPVPCIVSELPFVPHRYRQAA